MDTRSQTGTTTLTPRADYIPTAAKRCVGLLFVGKAAARGAAKVLHGAETWALCSIKENGCNGSGS